MTDQSPAARAAERIEDEAQDGGTFFYRDVAAEIIKDEYRPTIEALEKRVAELEADNIRLQAVYDECRAYIADHLPDVISPAREHADTVLEPEKLARIFHYTYERLAPTFNWETQRSCRTDWEQLPASNRALMVAVAIDVVAALNKPAPKTPIPCYNPTGETP